MSTIQELAMGLQEEAINYAFGGMSILLTACIIVGAWATLKAVIRYVAG